MSSASNHDKPELIAVPLAAVSADKPLSFAVHLKRPLDPSEPFQALVPTGKTLATEAKQSLLTKVDTVYISRRAWPQFFGSVEKFKAGGNDFHAELAVARIWAVLYGIDAELKGTLDKSSFEKQKLLSDWLALSLAKVTSTKGFFRRFNDPQLYLMNHSFNVAIASAIVAKKLGFGMDAQRLVTLGSLMHNIGNIQIPRALLHKTGPLTKTEWDKMKMHPRRGAEMLYLVNAPREVILTSMQHHEHLDGNGYPELIYGHEIHLFAKICSAVDVFDALKSPRPYESPMEQERAVQTIVNMSSRFEGQILNIVSSIEE